MRFHLNCGATPIKSFMGLPLSRCLAWTLAAGSLWYRAWLEDHFRSGLLGLLFRDLVDHVVVTGGPRSGPALAYNFDAVRSRRFIGPRPLDVGVAAKCRQARAEYLQVLRRQGLGRGDAGRGHLDHGLGGL